MLRVLSMRLLKTCFCDLKKRFKIMKTEEEVEKLKKENKRLKISNGIMFVYILMSLIIMLINYY